MADYPYTYSKLWNLKVLQTLYFFWKYIDCWKFLSCYPVRYMSAYRFITRNCIFAKKKVEVENLQSKINSQWHINYVDVLITSSFLLNMLHGVSHNNLWVSVQIFHLKIKIVLYCLYKSYICAIHFKYYFEPFKKSALLSIRMNKGFMVKTYQAANIDLNGGVFNVYSCFV